MYSAGSAVDGIVFPTRACTIIVFSVQVMASKTSFMKIDSFSFGKISIGGKVFAGDVIVYPDRVECPWVREEEHRPQINEFADIVSDPPDVLVIGTGYAGVMSVADQVRNYLTSRGIDVHVEKTKAAVELYNSLVDKEKVIAVLHIAC